MSLLTVVTSFVSNDSYVVRRLNISITDGCCAVVLIFGVATLLAVVGTMGIAMVCSDDNVEYKFLEVVRDVAVVGCEFLDTETVVVVVVCILYMIHCREEAITPPW